MVMLMSVAIEASAAGPRKAWSESDNAFVLKTSDGLEQYTVDGTITFIAAKNDGDVPTGRDCGVVFSPANEGEVIQITVNSCTLDGTNCYLLLYDGAIEKIGYNTSDGVDQSRYLPAGWVKKYSSSSVGETYISTSDDGKLSFGFHSPYSGVSGQKFNITVTSLSPKDMEYVSTTAITGLANTYRGAKNQEIFGVDVVMDGGGSPLTLNELTIDASPLAGSTQVSNVRLMNGTAVLATAATVGDNLTASDVALKNGHNKLMVVADILPDATGDIPSLTIQSVKVDNEVRTATATTGDAVTIDNTILMGAEATTYTISDAANFYDDGGKEGKIGSKFNGQVTFVPATEGQAIKVDFTKLAIFNTSSTGMNDVFKFYNGRTADEANLITTLLKDAEIVKSTAEDGSMTVTLNSTTGVPADGWEATVSQFLPGDMTLDAVTGEAASTATVAAGDKEAQMLVIDVQTNNTSNPLSVNGISLSAADAKNIDKITAYYLGKKNEFATTNKFGEATVNGTAIALSGAQELIEGHNYFAIVLDVKDEAQNGEEITVSLQDVTVGDATQAPSDAVSATRVVDNICRATVGSHSHIITGDWKFTTTEGYSGKYEAQDADYIVTFTPGLENTVAEIDFSSFDVTYSSSTYSGVRAVFEIYSGTSIDPANLLWNLKDNSESQVGPGKVIRSTSADGSLTIRFNPKTTSSYYAGTGWIATVRPFQNHDMTINEVKVNQTSSDVIAVGSTDADLIDVEIVTEGTLTVKTLTGVKLDLKDSQSSVAKVNVYYNNANDRESAVLFGTVENPETSAITIAGEHDLAEGSNYLWVTVDVKNDAEAEAVIDAKVTALVDASGETAVENGDPEGERVVKYIYIIQSGTNVVTVTEPLLFYDDGGPEGKLTKGFKGTTIFQPGRENSAVQIKTLNTFSIGSGKMYIYSGREANADNILGKVTGYSTTTGPDLLVSKAEDGSLTVVFEANTTATTLDGWEMEVSLKEKTPYTIEDIEVTNTTDPVMRNSQDNVMQQIKLNVSGDKDPISISSIKFGATGSSYVAAAKVYYTAHNSVFNTDNLLGSLSSVADGDNFMTFDNPLTISDNGDYYLWMTYDIDQEATAGRTVTALFKGMIVGEAETTAEATAAERMIKAGLMGNYIIGPSSNAHYANFAEATTALQGGIEGAVTFLVEDGTYAENVWFSNVPGAGEQNTITFTSLNGNKDNVIVSGSGSSENIPGSTSYKKGMVFVETTPYVTFEKMSFIPAKESAYTYVVCIFDRSHHFTLRECHVKATPVTSGYSGINLVKTYAINEDGRNNDYPTFENNVLDGGYIALYLGGTNNVGLTREKGLVVRGNTISEAGSKGIYIYDEDDAVVENNTIYQSTVQKTGYWGIDVARLRGNTVIAGNKITNTTSYYSGGIQLRTECYGSDSNPIRVYNNAVSITNSPSTSSAGIQIDIDQKNVALYNNTVRIGGSNGYCFYSARRTPISYENITVQNNLFQNMTSSPAMFILSGYGDKPNFVNNAFYGATVMADTDIEALNAMDGNSGNIVEQAEFLSETDLHLMSAGNLNMGLPVDFISTDADGVQRNATTPTVGAYEFAEVVEEKPEIAEDYPVVGNVAETTADVTTKWTVGGKLYSHVVKVTETAGGAPAKAPFKAPTADDLKAGEPVDIMADTEKTTTFTELDPATQYKAYFLAVSALGVESDVVESEVFTTLRHIEPLTVTLTGATIDEGDEAILTPVMAGGDEPYTYEWTDQMNNNLGGEQSITVQPEYTWGYRLKVTSADGQTATAKTGVIVRGEQVIATFDDNYLPENSHDDVFDLEEDVFYSGSYAFNQMSGSYSGYYYWSGYGMSNETSTSFSNYGTDEWRNVTGTGHNSSNYAVAYPEGLTVEITNDEEGDSVMGVYVTNTPVALISMRDGDGFAQAFKPGSYFTLTVTGTAADGSRKSVDFNLGDYRASEANRYILETWEWIDLRPLGKVTTLRFTFSGSESGQYGLNTPKYFALDDLGCMPDVTEAEVDVTLGESVVDLSNYFSHADNGALERYYLNDEVDNDVMTVSKDGDDSNLQVNAKQQGKRTMLVSMTAKGHTQWVMLTINVSPATAVDQIDASRQIQSVQYVNALGQVSDRPFEGVNVIVTRYTDGTTSTVKVRK